jgi:ATP-dependent DNA helicase RecG
VERERRPLPRQRLALDASVRELAGVGPLRHAQLVAAGVETLRDLLWRLPARYEDRTTVLEIAALASFGAPARAAVVGELHGVRSQRLPRRRGTLSRASVRDDSGSLDAVWFNRPYLARQVAPGQKYLLSGTVRPTARGLELVNPSLERWTGTAPSAPTPIYARLGALGPTAVRRLLEAALERADLERDPLPPHLLDRHGLPTVGEALRALHRPGPGTDVDALCERSTAAHRRLAYGELFALQLRLALLRERSRRRVKPQRFRVDDRVRALARQALPFRLTGAQRRALKAIVDDLLAPQPMARLLQGDVGSGKTVVAALAMLVALANGHQVAFMAPTELLAEQHARNLELLLGGRFAVGLLTRSSPERAAVVRRAAGGEAMLVVGTQALIEDTVLLPRLGLVVIDEQHRFGVAQRQRLASKGRRADLLVMTATPIPRSLALVLYGDLDLSVLDETPPGRWPVSTRLVKETARDEVLAAIHRHCDEGGQCFVVFPRVVGEDGAVPAVEERGRWYLDRLPERRSGILTGRTPAAARDRLMARVAAGDLDVLVATTVIEVGIDVPNATLMVIEGAVHFGLSQLHQLRGRVGRGARAAECIAVVGAGSPDATGRLETFVRCDDGFRIAEADLELRGPGDLLGLRQSGVEALRIADPLRHADLLEAARADARELARSLDDTALAESARRSGGRARPPDADSSALRRGTPCQDAAP